jgi:molybdopterin molybdotransferase
MLTVRPVAEAIKIIHEHFGKLRTKAECVALDSALDRILAQDIIAKEIVPDFNRSTVDGYAVIGSDVFGCSDTIPALLTRIGESFMGRHADLKVEKGQCVYVPTGGEVPEGADTLIMLEYAEELGDAQVAFYKPAAPGTNMIFRGDDTKPGEVILPAGRRINVADTGTLAAIGVTEVPVMCQPRVGIITTGDELVLPGEKLEMGQIRDVNGPMLMHAVKEAGGIPFFWGIIRDDDMAIKTAIQNAIMDCDLLILTGGTSVGEKDAAPRVISELGTMLVHGLAAKPGKPTLFGEVNSIPVFGLSGNPLAAYFMFYLLIRPLLFNMQGYQPVKRSITLPLERSIPSNQGREEFVPVMIKDGIIHPIANKSGLITLLANTDGFIRIPRDLEGLPQGAMVEVTLFTR